MSVCQQIWKTWQWPRSAFIPVPKKGNAKECSNYHTIAFIAHASKALEKEMATHSSVLAWRIPGMGEPGGLPSMGSHQVRHDWSDLAAAAAVKQCSKFSKLGFNYTRTENFHMYKLHLEKARGTRDQIANICLIIEKARELQKNMYFCFIDYAKTFGCVDHNRSRSNS